jgi:hypothetical protein
VSRVCGTITLTMAEPQKQAPEPTTPPPAEAVTEAAESTAPESTLPVPEETQETSAAPKSLSWSAAEFHVHEKSVSWYMLLALATIAIGGILYLWTRSIVTLFVVVIGGGTIGIFGTHRPSELEYVLDRTGIRIGSKHYMYDEFRLFIVTPQSVSPEVTLVPTKRFMPSLSVRYTPENEEAVLNILADHLPFEERRLDLIDSLMQRIRF